MEEMDWRSTTSLQREQVLPEAKGAVSIPAFSSRAGDGSTTTASDSLTAPVTYPPNRSGARATGIDEHAPWRVVAERAAALPVWLPDATAEFGMSLKLARVMRL